MSRQEILYPTKDLSKIRVSEAKVISSTFDFNITPCTTTTADFSESGTGIIIFPEEIPVINLRIVSLEEAKEEIYNYIKKNPGCRTSDIIVNLELDPDLVLKALSQLRCEERIEGKSVE